MIKCITSQSSRKACNSVTCLHVSPVGMNLQEPRLGPDTDVEARVHRGHPLLPLQPQPAEAQVGVQGVHLGVHPLGEAAGHRVLGAEDKPPAGRRVRHLQLPQQTQGGPHPEAVARVLGLVGSAHVARGRRLPLQTPAGQLLQPPVPEVGQPPHQTERRHSAEGGASVRLEAGSLAHPALVADALDDVLRRPLRVHAAPVVQDGADAGGAVQKSHIVLTTFQRGL